ncbi:MAG: polysaccharide deacetylase family protein [Candidatus Riflebacteria bacterium]|nr:polysaccharide deacetylase family protein [Candidatus Riflebacteria bacterium]
MLQINISDKFFIEKKYIIRILFKEFLGLDYTLSINNEKNNRYEIILPNNKKLLFEDCFWVDSDESYLKKDKLPVKVDFSFNQFIVEQNIPIIYGNERIEVSEDLINCGIDIFASSFFMLTRWEEYVNETRDQHNRFPATASLAFRFGFLDRPLVNEYVEMLWNMLKYLGFEKKRKQHNFEMLLTHDVDSPFKYINWRFGLGEICRDLFKNHNIKLATDDLLYKIKSHLNPDYDPYNTFDFLMNQSERLGLKSHFFFMGGGLNENDGYFDIQNKKIQSLVKEIKKRGHIIGFHPSYEAYKKPELWKSEKENVEKSLNIEVKTGREHYLRFETPYTWQIWEDNKMDWESTLIYADKEGFRCGTCWSFPVFNFLTRKELNLLEKPLIVMEACFFNYQKEAHLESIKERINFLKDKCKKYNGTFVYLWHNSHLANANKNLYIDTINH